VDRPIQFDDQFELGAVEIRDPSPDDVLPPELHPQAAPVAQ
jgi:hypothetical protein